MSLVALFALMITLTAVLSWLNERFLRLPQTIGVMLAALCLSLLLLAAGGLGWLDAEWGAELLAQVDFNAVLMRGMLSFLLFAGALHVDLSGLLQQKWTILVLATVGVVCSTFLIGTAFYGICLWVGIEMPYLVALIFGALISPTDPIAVLGILKKARVPERVELNIVGESLFNDGVGVVIFTILVGFLTADGHVSPTVAGVAELFLVEAVGGALFGMALGFVAYSMLRSVDNYTVEILITLSLVAGGYTLAGALHTSGPIAMVVAGLFIGNHGRVFGMSEQTRGRLDDFWEVVDEILNALLFVMIGLEILILELQGGFLWIAALAIPLVLFSRLVCIGVPLALLRLMGFEPRRLAVLTWAGLRGGISVALALSLPASPQRDLILVVSYAVVVFSIAVQGLTVGRVVRWAGLART